MSDPVVWALIGVAVGFVWGLLTGVVVSLAAAGWLLRGMVRLGRRIKEHEQEKRRAPWNQGVH